MTTIIWPISIPRANSKAATNVLFDPTRFLNAFENPKPCINPKNNITTKTTLYCLSNVLPAVKILNNAMQKIVIGISSSVTFTFKFIML